MDGINRFWLIVIEVWEQGLFGMDIGRIVVAALIFIGFLRNCNLKLTPFGNPILTPH